jgi:APA family basic amino acid/polyamine antiporter
VAALIVTAINAAGIRRSVHVTDVVVILSISSLAAFVILGLPHGNLANFVPFAPSGFTGILRATGLIFFAYTGYSRIATLVEEVRNPRRNSKGYSTSSWFRYTPIPFRCGYRDCGTWGD